METKEANEMKARAMNKVSELFIYGMNGALCMEMLADLNSAIKFANAKLVDDKLVYELYNNIMNLTHEDVDETNKEPILIEVD